jgi:hypothetical protein
MICLAMENKRFFGFAEDLLMVAKDKEEMETLLLKL